MTYRKNNKKKSPSYSERKYQEMQYQKFQSENEFFLELEPEIEPQLEPEPISECSICMEQIINENDKVITRCNHHFHSGCLHRWTMQNNSCPNCRTLNAAVCYIGYPNLNIDIPDSPASIIRNSPFYHILEEEITPSTDTSSPNNYNVNTQVDNYIDNVYNNVNNILNDDISSNFINNIITSSIDQLENLDTQLRHYEGIVETIHAIQN
jgi:hypothetical protein